MKVKIAMEVENDFSQFKGNLGKAGFVKDYIFREILSTISSSLRYSSVIWSVSIRPIR